MCGRFSLTTTKTAVETALKGVEAPEQLPLRYNIAPTQQALVVTDAAPHKLQAMYWGLVPYWESEGKPNGMRINARMETIFEKPSFREPILHRRCLVIMDSFYEWRKTGGQKRPFRILSNQGELLVAAGIWDKWGSGENAIESFSIITIPANKEMSSIHDRMPLFLINQEQRQKWLSPMSKSEIDQMLHTSQDDILELYSVSEKVNKVANDGPELHQHAPEQLRFF